MKLKEYEGKEIFKKYKIDVPKGYVVSDVKKIKDIGVKDLILKAQVLVGGRKKSGGIMATTSGKIKKDLDGLFTKKIKGLKVEEVLVEEKLEIEDELYLSVTIDRFARKIKILYSDKGGIDIEDNSENVVKMDDLHDVNISVRPLAEKLLQIMKDYDASLVEINPLVVSKGKFIAADAKIIIDDNALFRHLEFVKNKVCYAEERASMCGFNYVELKGNIGVIGNGAGLVMATLDVLDHFGGKAANFLDVGGGASGERMKNAIEVVLLEKPKVLLVNIFGGITRCDDIAKGIVDCKIDVPMVVRLTGTNEEEGRKLLKENGINSFDSMEKCVKKAVEVAKNAG